MASTASIKINIDSSQASKSVGQLQNEISSTTKELNKAIRTFGTNSEVADDYRRKLAKLDIELTKLGGSTNDMMKSQTSLKTELRNTIRELEQLEVGSPRFKELALRAGELRDQIGTTNDIVNKLSGNVSERLFRGITSVTQIGVAGFQAMTSVVALTGVESEELTAMMVKLQAVMNLSQALNTLSDFPDMLKQVTAGFGSLFVSQTAQTTATNASTVATKALGVAMKALPIFAIIGGISLLVAAVSSYTEESKKAKKEEEERKKLQEELNKAEKERVQTIAKESTQFVGLIFQLKATNVNSKERLDLIKDINDQYGTTLQNLQDETKFQEQLNVAVEEYVKVQRNKFLLQKNQEQFQTLLEQELELNKFIERDYKTINNEASRLNITFGEASRNLSLVDKEYRKNLQTLEDVRQKMADLGGTALELNNEQNQLTDDGKKYEKQNKNTSKSVKTLKEDTEKYAELLQQITNEIRRQEEAEKQLLKIQTDRITDVEKRQITLLEQTFGQERDKIIQGAIDREVKLFEEKFKKEGKTREEYDKGIAEIRQRGTELLLDVEKQLLTEKEEVLKDEIKLVEERYKTEEDIVLQSVKSIQDETRLLELAFAKEQEIRAIEQSSLTEEKKQEEILKIKKKFLDKEIDLIKTSSDNQIKQLTLLKDRELSNKELSASQRKQIEERYNQEVLKINQDTQNKIGELIDGTKEIQLEALEQLELILAEISKYVSSIDNLFSQFATTISMINQERFDEQKSQIDGLYEYEKQALDNQLADGIISREEFDNKVKELDQQKQQEDKRLRMEAFYANKKLNIANAIINGAQSVLSTFAQTPGGIILKTIAASIAAGFSGVQIGVIKNQEFRANRGGIVPGSGPGHIDSVNSLLAPGETVINSQSSRMFPELLNQINMSGGGVDLRPSLPSTNKNNNESVFNKERNTQTIRAYVVETDVTDSQRRINRIKDSVEF